MTQIRYRKIYPPYTKMWSFKVRILSSSGLIVNFRLSAEWGDTGTVIVRITAENEQSLTFQYVQKMYLHVRVIQSLKVKIWPT